MRKSKATENERLVACKKIDKEQTEILVCGIFIGKRGLHNSNETLCLLYA